MSNASNNNPITGLELAVIGMAGRFPNAQNVEAFWENLKNGVESISFFSVEELRAAGIQTSLLDDANYIRANGILDDIAGFDAAFFGYTPREAEIIDPQQRIFLETAWEALERAGYGSERNRGAVGLYAGTGMNTYLLNNIQPNRSLVETIGDAQIIVNNDKDFLATRVSYKLNLRGPSFTVQTACSTSLVAIHLAGQGLLSGECDLALAGGVAVRTPHKAGYLHQEGGIGSADGHCRAFDAGANGTTFGNGVGVVVLKRLDDALNDGDPILAVVKGSSINNDGSLKVGYTAPSVEGQAKVIQAAQLVAEVEPQSIGYIEAHGTGTTLGDPIEISALTQAFQTRTNQRGFCAIGAVKSNIGHLDTAAGVAGFIKTVLSLKNKQIVPSLHFERPNPKIDFENSPFYVNTKLADWPTGNTPRRAGISSFGIGGTNAHIILEEAPPLAPSSAPRAWQLLLLSARTASALDTASVNLSAHLKNNPEQNLADAAYTLQIGRTVFRHRRIFVCQSTEDAVHTLETPDPKRVFSAVDLQDPRRRPIAFMFSGQGAQYINMARELYDGEPQFRAVIDRCCELLRPHLGLDLRDVLYPAAGKETTATQQLTQTSLAQPALFVISYALAQLWMSWGIQPQAMIGHSIGEYVAACLSGVFSLEDALMLVSARGQLMQRQPAGSMLAVPLSEAEIRPWLGETLDLAAINGPAQCVVSGPTAEIEALQTRLADANIEGRPLHTSHAFHSSQMDAMVQPFVEKVGKVQLRAPQSPYISNVTGTWITPAEATDPAYWGQHVRGAVRFSDGLQVLLDDAERVLLEVGPGTTLCTLSRQHSAKKPGHVIVNSLRHPQEQGADEAFLLQALGKLWLAGVNVDWERFYDGQERHRVLLPTYPFEHQRYWLEAPKASTTQQVTEDVRKKLKLNEWFSIPSWKRSILPPVPAADAEKKLRWLVFGENTGFAAQLVQQLAQTGQMVVSVTAGERFEKLDDYAYTIAPQAQADYNLLYEALRASENLPDQILHLWSMGNDGKNLEKAQHLCYYSLLFLAQEFGKQTEATASIPLRVISSEMQAVSGEGRLHPEKALLLGPCKVIPQEYPRLACQSIDLLLPAAGSTQETVLLKKLLTEFNLPPKDDVVAYRDQNRWVQSFEPVRLDEAPATPAQLRDGGVYLITGGLGGVGLELAESLAQTVETAKLVLLGRTVFPAPQTWADWLANHPENDPVSRQILRLQVLEQKGAELLLLNADVADETQMRAVLSQTRERFGALHGVIHAAGISGGGMIQLKTADSADAVLRPKVAGTLLLHTLLKEIKPDWLMLCSSLSAVIGGFGLVDYCAANAFMDAFAQAQNAENDFYVTSVNWDRWHEIGMAQNPNTALKIFENQAQAQAVNHPLLNRYLAESAERAFFLTDWSEAQHWVLAEHKVMGNPTLPGATYPEMARAVFKQHTQAESLEISSLYFEKPLILAADETREALTLLEKDGAGYRFRALSRIAEKDGVPQVWQEHAKATISHLTESVPGPIQLDEIKARCRAVDTSLVGYEIEAKEQFVQRGPRWKSLEKFHQGTNERLIYLKLADAFLADLEGCQLHPALLDVATGFARPAEEEKYLPFAYEKMRVWAGLTPELYSHIRYKDEAHAHGEIITCDVTLADKDGMVLVEIEGFALKRVGVSAAASLKSTPIAEKPLADAALMEKIYQKMIQPASTETSVDGILAAEGREALRRIFAAGTSAQWMVSTRNLAATIETAKTFTAARILEDLASLENQPAHARPEIQTAFIAPTNELEQRIAVVWQRMLGIEQVGVDDNFFELGGDSLIGIRLISELKKELQIEDLPVVSLFEAPTISLFAKYLHKEQTQPTSFDHSRERADKKRMAQEQREAAKDRRRK